MYLKLFSRYTVLGLVFILSICIELSINNALAENPPRFPDIPDECGNNNLFTTDFRLEDCEFEDTGENPYFIIKPGYRLVLETPEDEDEREKSVETVLHDKKKIYLNGRTINTSVLEERAFEWEEGENGEEGEWKIIEISLNWVAICKRTNAVYYFGEWSRDCEDGFNDEDVCEGVESNEGSWEAGVDGAMPGLLMPGTPLLGARYFQEIAPEGEAVDRGQIAGISLDWPEGLDEGEDSEFTGCIKIFDTNPVDGECGDGDTKIYCPGVGLVQDQDLELISYGFEGDGSPPSKVIHTSPSGQIQNSTPTFTWVADSGSTWYKLWIGYNSQTKIFEKWYQASNICSGGTCSVTSELELLNDDYKWYIKSWNDYGKVWSAGMSFAIEK